jgi:hypothetical protein
MAAEGLTLGEFGDERLAKRGLCFCRGWLRGRASAFVVWRAVVEAESSASRDFSRIRG